MNSDNIKKDNLGKPLNLPKGELRHLYWDELKSLQEIGKIYNCCSVTIMRWMTRHKIPRRVGKEFSVKPRLEWTPDLAYIVGVILGDGNVYRNKVTLAVTDEIFASSFKNKIEKIGLHPCLYIRKFPKKYPNWRNQYVVQAESKLFCNWIRGLNVVEINRFPNKLFVPFIKGFYESEGCLALNGRFPYFVLKINNTNIELLTNIWNRLKREGFNFKWNVDGRNRTKVIGYEIRLFKRNHIKKFLDVVKPCIKDKIKCNKACEIPS